MTYKHSHKSIGLVQIAGIVIYRNKILLYLHFIYTIVFPIINNLLTHSLLIIALPLLSLPLTQGAVIVVIIWQLDLQLPMQSVPITTNVESLNPTHGYV
jgi:hypothetical protein